MVEPKKDDQLWLFPFLKIVRNKYEFLTNLAILKDWRRDAIFRVRITSDNWAEFLDCSLEIGAYITAYIDPVAYPNPPEVLLDNLDEKQDEDFLKCKECGAPAIYFLNCSCGTYAWCEEHEDATVLWDHADHECSSECCARGHSAETRSIAELEAMVSPLEISMEARNQKDISVKVRQKSEQECIDELESLMGKYLVRELKGKLKTEFDYTEPSLEIGSEAVITPTDLGSQTLALAVVRHEKPLIVTIVEKKSGWDYICLLPEGTAIRGHSRPYKKSKCHYIVLSRDELEPVISREP